jgi:glycosyltransferase involved in cell wall biosynthesis
MGLPEWDDWWPTLEELRDSAKAYKLEPHGTITVIVHTDGRKDYISKSIPSLVENITGNIVKWVIYDDSGDREYKAWLKEQFGDRFYIIGPDRRLGYTESMRSMWVYLRRRCTSDYVFQAEDDFLYDQPVDLGPMLVTLENNPHLRQLALLRHAYYPKELEAGSIINEHPEDYEIVHANGHSRVEHRLYFTANPSLFPRSLTAVPWPTGKSSERAYTDVLNRDPLSRFAYWGSGEELVTHIGAVRAGTDY